MDTAPPLFKCKFCDKELRFKSSLTRHLKEVHNKDLEGKPLSVGDGEKFTCDLCNETFTRKSNLQHHITVQHDKLSKPSKESLLHCINCTYSTIYKANLKRHILKCNNKSSRPSIKIFKCLECDANFKQKSSLKRHIQKGHKRKQLLIARKCPLCSFQTHDHPLKSLHDHFKNVHNVDLKWENYSFSSLGDFYEWKKKVENITKTSYVLFRKCVQTFTFQCHRCGIFKPAGRNKRHQKIVGTCKINGFCPGSMKVKVKNDLVTVLYQSVHVGHENELKHIRLSKEERRYLASKLFNKVPHEEIIRNVRASLSNSDLNRIHLLNKKDLANIKRDFKLNRDGILHTNDHTYDSIESWATNLTQSSNPGLTYESQGEKNEEYLSLEEKNVSLICETKAPTEFEESSQLQEHILKELKEISKEKESANFEEKKEMLLSETRKLEHFFSENCKTVEQINFSRKTLKKLMTTIRSMDPG